MRRGGDCATSRHAAGRIGVDQNELVLQKTGLDTFSLNQGVQGSSPWRCIRSPGIRIISGLWGFFLSVKEAVPAGQPDS